MPVASPLQVAVDPVSTSEELRIPVATVVPSSTTAPAASAAELVITGASFTPLIVIVMVSVEVDESANVTGIVKTAVRVSP